MGRSQIQRMTKDGPELRRDSYFGLASGDGGRYQSHWASRNFQFVSPVDPDCGKWILNLEVTSCEGWSKIWNGFSLGAIGPTRKEGHAQRARDVGGPGSDLCKLFQPERTWFSAAFSTATLANANFASSRAACCPDLAGLQPRQPVCPHSR